MCDGQMVCRHGLIYLEWQCDRLAFIRLSDCWGSHLPFDTIDKCCLWSPSRPWSLLCMLLSNLSTYHTLNPLFNNIATLWIWSSKVFKKKVSWGMEYVLDSAFSLLIERINVFADFDDDNDNDFGPLLQRAIYSCWYVEFVSIHQYVADFSWRSPLSVILMLRLGLSLCCQLPIEVNPYSCFVICWTPDAATDDEL